MTNRVKIWLTKVYKLLHNSEEDEIVSSNHKSSSNLLEEPEELQNKRQNQPFYQKDQNPKLSSANPMTLNPEETSIEK